MKHEPHKIPIRKLVAGYVDQKEEGVRGYNGKLNIRPPYQREFVYKTEQRDKVIDSVRKGYPLNTIYWVANEDGSYEVLDGQQRIISICRFHTKKGGRFSIKDEKFGRLYFSSMDEDERNKFLDYELSVYICSGKEKEKMEWFRRINVVGEPLTDQELRNALFHGPWVTEVKKMFSRVNGPAQIRSSKYVNARANRQEYLETALNWYRTDVDNEKGDNLQDKIQACMSRIHENEPPEKLWKFYEGVIDWIEAHFPTERKEMKGVDWGELYREYKNAEKDPDGREKLISDLLKSGDVRNGSDVYRYAFSGNAQDLQPRLFTEADKRQAYEKQEGKCSNPDCRKECTREEMQADHIEPWKWGGLSVQKNCQMLCHSCHKEKTKMQGRIAAETKDD